MLTIFHKHVNCMILVVFVYIMKGTQVLYVRIKHAFWLGGGFTNDFLADDKVFFFNFLSRYKIACIKKKKTNTNINQMKEPTSSDMTRSSIFSREITVVSLRALFRRAMSPKLSPRFKNIIVLGTPSSIAETIAGNKTNNSAKHLLKTFKTKTIM